MYARIRTVLVAAALVSTAAGTTQASAAQGCTDASRARYRAVATVVESQGGRAGLVDCTDEAGPELDPYVCPWFIFSQGTYYVGTPFGNVVVVYIAPDGDVYVAGLPVWNCPPY